MSNELKELTQTLIQTQILKALKSSEEYLDTLVRAVMETEVDSHGAKPDTWAKEKMPWLEWATRSAIRDAARQAVLAAIAEMKPQIEATVRKALTADAIVQPMVKKIMADVGCEWAIDVVLKPRD